MRAEENIAADETGDRNLRRRLLLALGALYFLLLVFSNGARLINPADRLPALDQRSVDVAAVGGAGSAAEAVRIAYRDLGSPDAPPVLVLHGTPVASAAVTPLARQLAQSFRVIVPDLPGLGASSRWVADYSSAAHGTYIHELLERLAIPSAHLVAYSQGGAVALSLAHEAPEKVRSIVMLSAIGVQELELLGDYHLNHALYAAQLGVIRAMEWLLPHFGFLDTAILNSAYARNVYDTDQRPLRSALAHYREPMLIVHGRDDGLVPLAAAREHHRLVPQSSLHLLDGGHMLALQEPQSMARVVLPFLESAERGMAPKLDDAEPVRLQAASLPFDWKSVPAYKGLTLVLVLLMLALATYVSEDLACIAAGLMVARGLLDFVPASAVCLIGIYSGDLLLYLSGRIFGSAVVHRAPLRWFVREDDLTRSRAWFDERGAAVIFVSRFVPGTRLPSYVVAGVLRMPLLRFSLYFLLAALLWTPLLIGAAVLLGGSMLEMFDEYRRYSLPVLAAVLLIMWMIVRLLLPLLRRVATQALLRFHP
ncbi:MAG: hypothetical protein Cons2KO_13500 [Congregibacter sp.]